MFGMPNVGELFFSDTKAKDFDDNYTVTRMFLNYHSDYHFLLKFKNLKCAVYGHAKIILPPPAADSNSTCVGLFPLTICNPTH